METKKELKIDHLVPYLPYDLKITFNGDEYQHELVGVDITSIGVKLLSPFNDYGSARFEDVKPLLHPLDRLDILGDEKLPINEHSINQLLVEKHGVEYGMFSVYKNEISLAIDRDWETGVTRVLHLQT